MHRSVNVQTISGGKSNLFLKIMEDKDTQYLILCLCHSEVAEVYSLPCGAFHAHINLIGILFIQGWKQKSHFTFLAMQIPGGLIPIVPESC